MKSFLIKYSSAITGITLIILCITIGRELNTYFIKSERKELQAFGVSTVAKIVSITSAKRGYDISYDYYVVDEKMKVGELVNKYPADIKVGDCYSIIYSKKNPLTRKVDFLKKVECEGSIFETTERLQLQKKCSCTSGKIKEVRKNGSGGAVYKYNIHTDRGGYSKYVEVNRKLDAKAIFEDSFFLVLFSPEDYSIQRIFLNTPKGGMPLDTFPSEIQCRKAINDLAKKQKETPYIY